MRPTSSLPLPCHPGPEPSLPMPMFGVLALCVGERVHVCDPVGKHYREGSVIPVLGCSSTPPLLPPLTLHKRRLGPTLLPSVSEGEGVFALLSSRVSRAGFLPSPSFPLPVPW